MKQVRYFFCEFKLKSDESSIFCQKDHQVFQNYDESIGVVIDRGKQVTKLIKLSGM